MTTPSTDKVKLPILAAFGLPALPVAAIGLVMAVYLPNFFAKHVGISLAAVGSAFMIVRLIDMGLDPLLGLGMDKTRSGLGRFRPWMLIGSPFVMAAIWFLFNAQPGMSEVMLIGWLLVLYLGVSILTLGQAAWAASLATDYHDRSRIYGVLQAVGVIGAVAILFLPLIISSRGGSEVDGIRAMSWFLIIMIPVTVAICAIVTPERIVPDRNKVNASLADYWALVCRPEMIRLLFADFVIALGPGTVAALYLFFFHDARGYSIPQTSILLVLFIAAGLLGAVFWAWLARRIGKHRAVMTCTVAFGISQAALVAIPAATMSLAMPAMFAVGFVSSAFVMLVRAMVADVADEVRLETGRDQMGLLYALVTTTEKIGAAMTVGISFWILSLIGYNPAEGAVNTPAAIRGLEITYVFAPVILVFVGGACFFGWKLDARRHGEVRAALDALDAEAALLQAGSGINLTRPV